MLKIFGKVLTNLNYGWVGRFGTSIRTWLAKRRSCSTEGDLIYYKSDSSKNISSSKLVAHSSSLIVDQTLDKNYWKRDRSSARPPPTWDNITWKNREHSSTYVFQATAYVLSVAVQQQARLSSGRHFDHHKHHISWKLSLCTPQRNMRQDMYSCTSS